MYANASNDIPFYIHIGSYVVWRVHPQCFDNKVAYLTIKINLGKYHLTKRKFVYHLYSNHDNKIIANNWNILLLLY